MPSLSTGLAIPCFMFLFASLALLSKAWVSSECRKTIVSLGFYESLIITERLLFESSQSDLYAHYTLLMLAC